MKLPKIPVSLLASDVAVGSAVHQEHGEGEGAGSDATPASNVISLCSADELPGVSAEEEASREKSRERELKWTKMFSQWGKYFDDGKRVSAKVRAVHESREARLIVLVAWCGVLCHMKCCV